MKKKELLARIEALERRVEKLEARTPQGTYTLPKDNGTWWPNKDTCTCGITSIEPCPVHPIRYNDINRESVRACNEMLAARLRQT